MSALAIRIEQRGAYREIRILPFASHVRLPIGRRVVRWVNRARNGRV